MKREHTPRPGVTWETRPVRTETVVDDDAPDPRPGRAERRALARASRRKPMTDQPRDQVNRYARLDPIARALVDDHDAIALAEMLVKAHDDLEHAWQELQHHAEQESADAAAGSYASSSGHAIADPARWLHILFTSPDETTANTSALTLRDHLRAEFDGVRMRITTNAVEVGTHDARTTPAATEATGTWKEPTHPNPCTATIEGRATPGGRRVKCTREARHPENHVGPKLGANGRVLWTDHQPGATPHKEQQP